MSTPTFRPSYGSKTRKTAQSGFFSMVLAGLGSTLVIAPSTSPTHFARLSPSRDSAALYGDMKRIGGDLNQALEVNRAPYSKKI